MPTGYTEAIGEGDGLTFSQFAQRCARAFGATVMLRDDPLTNELPDRLPDSMDYYDKQIHATEMRISRLAKAKPNQIRAAMLRSVQGQAQRSQKSIDKARKLQKRYAVMLAKVGAWTPPSQDHEEFRRFMVQQLTDSADHDCDTRYYEKRQGEVMQTLLTQTPEQWRDEQLAELRRSLAYYRKERAKEKERSTDRNGWVQKLKESLESDAVRELEASLSE